jgi:uncharacterized cupredoxin-like copper-binding protein
MRRLLAALALVLAAFAAGCNGSASSTGDFQGEERQVADVVEKIQSAGETGDAREICTELLAKSLADEIRAAGSSCEQELEKAIDDADDFDLDVESVDITGDTATARVKGRDRGADRVMTFEFEREGSSWRATSLGA